jgi:hypothetical protein
MVAGWVKSFTTCKDNCHVGRLFLITGKVTVFQFSRYEGYWPPTVANKSIGEKQLSLLLRL